MICAVDIETKGLDATKFIMGCLWVQGRKKAEVYTIKELLWNRILELGKKQQKCGKSLTVVAHNHAYDFYGYADITDPNIVWFSHHPFITAYKQPRLDRRKNPETGEVVRQEIIKFTDSLAVFKMPLKSLGEAIKLPKLEMSEELYDEDVEVTDKLIEEITPYCSRDAEIVLRSIEKLKETLKRNGMGLKRIYTINQIAINLLIDHWRQNKEYHHVFWNEQTGETRRTFRAEEIHEAYRGGRVEAWKVGKYQNVNYIDCNSLYPYAAITMKFPDLASERKAYEPLKTSKLGVLLDKIGISRCIIKNNDCEVGVLPIRTQTGSYYPSKGKVLIGTWTHDELRLAIEEGYEMIDIEWSVTWKEAINNPFRTYIDKLYRMKKEATNDVDRYFAKMCMNAAFGKLAQRRTEQKIVLDSVEKAQEYLEENWEIIKGVDLNYMYKKESKKQKMKKYYTPILPTLLNAKARCYMYEQYEKIPKEHLLYTDTDSIMFTGGHNPFEITEEIGKFKTEHENEEVIIYGKKTYIIGEEAKIAGYRKRGITKEEFEKGQIKNKRMITMLTTNDTAQCGKFKEENRNLHKQMEENKRSKEMLSEMPVYVDCNIKDINFFIDKVSSIL